MGGRSSASSFIMNYFTGTFCIGRGGRLSLILIAFNYYFLIGVNYGKTIFFPSPSIVKFNLTLLSSPSGDYDVGENSPPFLLFLLCKTPSTILMVLALVAFDWRISFSISLRVVWMVGEFGCFRMWESVVITVLGFYRNLL